MPRIDYVQAIRCAGISALTSMVCNWCYVQGGRTPFFGVKVTGAIFGNRPQDVEFQKKIWQAARKHCEEVHGRKVVRNSMGGWKTIKVWSQSIRKEES